MECPASKYVVLMIGPRPPLFSPLPSSVRPAPLPLRPGSWRGFAFVLLVTRRTSLISLLLSGCSVPSNGIVPTSRYPQQVPIAVEMAQVRTRRAQGLIAMARRPGQVRTSRVTDEFDAFELVASAGRRGWQTATPDDVFDFLCYLGTQGKGTNMAHGRVCPGVGSAGPARCLAGSTCVLPYAGDSLRTGLVSKSTMTLKEHGKGEDWDPVRQVSNPCGSPLVDSYLTFISEEHKKVGVAVHQAPPMLAHTLVHLLSDMRSRAQVTPQVAERISLTRDVSLFSLAVFSMRRVIDLSFTSGSQSPDPQAPQVALFEYQLSA